LQNNFYIDRYKDRQEKLILIFTAVTVIFLPLSFIASVLGMNTNDVRNMDLSQWVYWVTAIPFTGALIYIIAWLAGETELLKPDFKKLLRTTKNQEEKPMGKWRSNRRHRHSHGI